MQRKIFISGNSTVISLPREALEYLGVGVGDEIEIELGENERQVILTAHPSPLASSVSEEFARQVSEFIDQYRPTLEALARQ
jgi:putative addiction module antidote